MKSKTLGYYAPYDMFEGKVKKGDLYVRSQSEETYYAFEAKTGILFYHLPAEIVTRWEAKYELTEDQMWEHICITANDMTLDNFILKMKNNYNITQQ